jgi:hypothetical protein
MRALENRADGDGELILAPLALVEAATLFLAAKAVGRAD